MSKAHEFVLHHFVAFSAKCTTSYETEVWSPRSERFVIFALGALLCSDFKQSARVCTKQRFQKEITTFCHFSLVTPLFNAFQRSTRVCPKQQSSVFCPRAARFVIFSLCAALISNFQQSAEVCTKQHFQPAISTCYHFCTGHTHHFLEFTPKSTSLYKTTFSDRDQHILSFSHWAHHFLQFSAKCTSLCKTASSARAEHVFLFSHWAHHFLAIFNKNLSLSKTAFSAPDHHVLSILRWVHHF